MPKGKKKKKKGKRLGDMLIDGAAMGISLFAVLAGLSLFSGLANGDSPGQVTPAEAGPVEEAEEAEKMTPTPKHRLVACLVISYYKCHAEGGPCLQSAFPNADAALECLDAYEACNAQAREACYEPYYAGK